MTHRFWTTYGLVLLIDNLKTWHAYHHRHYYYYYYYYYY
jgi:hypothetical protein